MNTSLKLEIPKLLSDLDALKLERLPLPLHFASNCDEHSRETYATLLAALLLANGAVSKNQSRLFKMLLASLQLGQIQARLYEQAQALNQDKLREFFRVVDNNQLAHSFFMDALVLCRLDQPLVEAQHQILSDLVDLLYLPEKDVPTLANLAAVVLGLPCDADFAYDFDYARYCVWGEFLYRTLTVEQLNKGVPDGRWQVTEPLELTSGWKLENVTLRFSERGGIKTKGEGNIVIRNCHLDKPVMQFEGALSFFMRESTISGNYRSEDKITALSFKAATKAGFNKVVVSTHQARSILLLDTLLRVNQCQFNECGNEKLNGGAIAFKYSLTRDYKVSPIEIAGSHFSGCVARLGGAIRLDQLSHENMIINTGFEDCTAFAYKDADEVHAGFGGGAIFADAANGFNFFGDKCYFINSSLNFGIVIWTYSSAGYIQSSSTLGRTIDTNKFKVFVKKYDILTWVVSENTFSDMDLSYKNIKGKNEESWWQDY